MTDDPYLEEVIQQARDADWDRDRSQQTELGWSEIGGCRAYMGFKLSGAWATDDTDEWRAIAGTALHEWLGGVRAAATARGDSVAVETEVVYRGVKGHIDEINYTAGEITDYKFPALAKAKVWDDPAVQAERFVQVQGYAAAVTATEEWQLAAPAHRVNDPLVRVLVAPVDGTFADWKTYVRPFDRAVADRALERYWQVKEMQAAGEPLPKDKPMPFCERYCEFFTLCRGGKDTGEGLPEITDTETAAALEAYGLAKEAASEAETAKDLLKPLLRGVRGTARGWKITWSKPREPSPVPDLAQIRADYENSDVELPMITPESGKPSISVTRVKK